MASTAATSATAPTSNAMAAIATPEPCATTPDLLPTRTASQFDIAHPQPSPTPSLRPSLSWKSVRSTLTVSEKTSAQLGWAVAFLSVVFTIVTLSPAFRSQSLSEKSVKLAEWTALKDFIEECREELAAGIESQACLKATNAKIPPPPYVNTGVLEKIRRGFLQPQQQGNGTWRGHHIQPANHSGLYFLRGIIFFGLIFATAAFSVLALRRSRVRFAHRSPPSTSWRKGDEGYMPSEATSQSVATPAVNTIRHPPPSSDTGLRRRREIRTHPMYRHANLEEAFHHEDMPEIRKRLENGEDVNKHWPYLIYRLAITPPSINTPKRLEIARLCLDFGADVNALKGWNGQSALMIAIHFRNVDVAKLLIVNGAMVSYSPPDSNLTALHRCVRLAVTGSANDAVEIMTLLFRYGADANQTDRSGETALHKLLIDAWYSRHDKRIVQSLLPVALCLVQHGGSLPEMLKKKYTIENPLLNEVRRAMRDTDFAKQLGPDSMWKRTDTFLVSDEEEEALQRGRLEWQNWKKWIDISGDPKGKMTVKWPSAFQETGLFL